jgi:GNAT superfamily N-acetyltransferase
MVDAGTTMPAPDSDHYRIRHPHGTAPGTTRDRAAVLALSHTFAAEDIAAGYRAMDASDLDAVADEDLWLVDHAGTIVGWAHGFPRPGAHAAIAGLDERMFALEDIYIATDHRRHGAGRRLLDTIEHELRTRTIARIILSSTSRDLARVMRFYHRAGFSTWSVAMHKPLLPP